MIRFGWSLTHLQAVKPGVQAWHAQKPAGSSGSGLPRTDTADGSVFLVPRRSILPFANLIAIQDSEGLREVVLPLPHTANV